MRQSVRDIAFAYRRRPNDGNGLVAPSELRI